MRVVGERYTSPMTPDVFSAFVFMGRVSCAVQQPRGASGAAGSRRNIGFREAFTGHNLVSPGAAEDVGFSTLSRRRPAAGKCKFDPIGHPHPLPPGNSDSFRAPPLTDAMHALPLRFEPTQRCPIAHPGVSHVAGARTPPARCARPPLAAVRARLA